MKNATRANATTAAMIGRKIAKRDITIAKIHSIVDTMGFAIPPVVKVDANRIPAKPPLIVPAAPPPAITASDHFIAGCIS